VKFYWEMVNYAQATGDTAGLAQLADTCPTCDSGRSFIERVYERGGELVGGDGRVHDAHVGRLQGRPGRSLVVHFKLTSTRQVEDYPGSDRDKTYPPGTIDFQIVLKTGPKGWAVSYLGEE
jgi:hypothetical protein